LELPAVDGKGEEPSGSGFQLWAKKGYKFACIDVLRVDGCFRAKHTKLKTS